MEVTVRVFGGESICFILIKLDKQFELASMTDMRSHNSGFYIVIEDLIRIRRIFSFR